MQNGKSTEQVLQYKKISFSAGVVPPDAPVGEWEFTVVRGKTNVKPIQSGPAAGSPRITFQFRIDQAHDEGNETYQGTQLPYRLDIVDNNDGSVPAWLKRRSAMQLQQLASECSFDLDILPKEMEGPDALTPFIEAVEGCSFTGWTTHRTSNDGRTFVDISLTKPGALFGAKSKNTDETDSDE